MFSVFYNFPNIASWKHCIGKDKTNQAKYDEPKDISVWNCGRKYEHYLNSDYNGIRTVHMYHVELGPEVEAGDLLDGHKVIEVEQVPDIKGETIFLIVRCEP